MHPADHYMNFVNINTVLTLILYDFITCLAHDCSMCHLCCDSLNVDVVFIYMLIICLVVVVDK